MKSSCVKLLEFKTANDTVENYIVNSITKIAV